MDYLIRWGYAKFDDDDVVLIVDHDDVKIYEIDMLTKYATLWYATTRGEIAVFIDKDERTLGWDTTKTEPTSISFMPESDDWSVIVESTVRYTARIVLYRKASDS